VREVSQLCDICYIRQKQQLGLGHAVLMAKDVIGNEPFALLLPDDIIDSEVPVLRQLADVHERFGGSVVAVERIKPEDSVKYGVISPRMVSQNIYEVKDMVEKPRPEDAPSDLGIVGRYILTPEIFEVLERTPPGKGNEIQLTDALEMLGRRQSIYACAFEGTRFDTGTPIGWLKAVVSYAMKHPDIGPEFREYLEQVMEKAAPVKV
jgi:UTP--glucose-1-phosphate uridylyltransferase